MPTAAGPSPEVASPAMAPRGVRIASTLCWIVGIVTILMALAMGIPALSESGGSVLWLVISCAVGGAVCVAAILIRRQRQAGVLILVLAWATPYAIALAERQTPHGGPILVIVALVLAASNWKHLR